MERHKIIDKLQNEKNISYEEARNALEKANWDILDAVLYLEEEGKLQKPSNSIFYTNEYKESHRHREIKRINNKGNNYSSKKNDNKYGGFFEAACKIIDTCNNIFFEIRKENRVLLRIPITVIVLLLLFAFWIVIPLFIVGLFFDMEFSLSGKIAEIDRINNVFKMISLGIKKLKEGLKKGSKNG